MLQWTQVQVSDPVFDSGDFLKDAILGFKMLPLIFLTCTPLTKFQQTLLNFIHKKNLLEKEIPTSASWINI